MKFLHIQDYLLYIVYHISITIETIVCVVRICLYHLFWVVFTFAVCMMVDRRSKEPYASKT